MISYDTNRHDMTKESSFNMKTNNVDTPQYTTKHQFMSILEYTQSLLIIRSKVGRVVCPDDSIVDGRQFKSVVSIILRNQIISSV